MFYEELCAQIKKGYLYLSRESQQFLVADQRDQMQKKGVYWDLHFRQDPTQHHQLVKFIEECAELQKTLRPNEERRLQLNYRISIHTLMIDFKVTSQGLKCFVLDAVNSGWVEGVTDTLKQSGVFDRVFVALPPTLDNTPQAIDGNCHFFTMEHAKAMLMCDPYDLLEQKSIQRNNIHVVNWESLPVQFIKDAETRAFLENYLAHNPNALHEKVGEQTFADYYFSRSNPNQSDASQYPNFPQRSYSIEMHAIQYFHDLQNRIASESQEAIMAACELQPVQSNEAWRAVKSQLKVEPSTREQLTFDEAFLHYRDPYGP